MMRMARSLQEKIDARSKRIIAIDLFCGIGGLTYGLSLSGVNVLAGYDNDASCRYAYESNNRRSTFYNIDVRSIKSQDVVRHYEGADVTVMVGCAPCQPFSAHTRNRKGDGYDDCSLVDEFARIVEMIVPDIVSMENVPGLVRHQAFGRLLGTLRSLGYVVDHSVLLCSDYGVPQTRRRLVLLASRLGVVSLPRPIESCPTVADLIRGLPEIEDGQTAADDLAHTTLPLSPRNRERIQQSRPGGTWKDWDNDKISRCHRAAYYPASYGRMRWDAPGPTITTQFCYYSTGRFGHPEQDRTISVREGALLQTFPVEYDLIEGGVGTAIHEIARHVGNAVPVRLAQAIGNSIVEAANAR